MTRKAAVLAIFAMWVLISLPGCGSSGGPATFLGENRSEVDYIQWQQSSSGRLQGTITIDRGSGTAPGETLSTASDPFTGSINGTAVSLTFRDLFGTTERVLGTVNGGTLTLQLPQSDGTIQSAVFATAGVSAFNKAVADLRGRVRGDNTRAARAEAAARQQRADAQAERDAQDDLSTLEQGVNFGADLASLATDVHQADKALGTVRSAAARGQGSYCNNVYNAGDDAYDVDDELYTLSDDLQSLTSDISAAHENIATVTDDVARLNASNLPPPAGVTADVSAARQAIRSAVVAANSYIDQADSDDSAAYAVANGLATGSCAGQGPGSPSALIKRI